MSKKPMTQKIVRISHIIQMAKDEFEQMKQEPALDSEFFTKDELQHYVNVLISEHKEDWLVIN